MLKADGAYGSNFIPQSFIPAKGLSQEDVLIKMVVNAKAALAKLSIPIPDHHTLMETDRKLLNSKTCHCTLINGQSSPEALDVECYDLAEAITFAPAGYFYPGMPEVRWRQLAATLSVDTPLIINHNTPD